MYTLGNSLHAIAAGSIPMISYRNRTIFQVRKGTAYQASTNRDLYLDVASERCISSWASNAS